MRFHPPRAPLPAELGWLLEAAFGPRLPPSSGDPRRIAEVARAFDLGPRIVARHGAAALRRLLGEAAAGPIREHRRGVAVALAAEQTAARLGELAGQLGAPLLFLKGFALQRLLDGPAGWRPYLDVDVLLEREAADELRQQLLESGWRGSVEAGNPQHLPPLTSPDGTSVDIHFRLRGIRVAAARWATVSELLAAGLCRPAGQGDETWLPSPTLLAAHLAVHALEQHGHRPATYPLLRAVADLVDLSTAVPDADLAGQAAALSAGSLAEDETRALFELAGVLAKGNPAAAEEGHGGAGILLRHIVAGVLDPTYRDSLVLDHSASRLREARRDGELMRYIARKLKGPAATPQDAVAGEPSGRSGSVRRRLSYPIHLCARFAAATAARLRRAIHR